MRLDEQGKSLDQKILTDDIPNIRIETMYGQNEPIIINDTLSVDKEENAYLYEIKSRLNQNKTYHYENDSFIMERFFIEINYKIDETEYVSLTAINTIEYK